MAEDFEVTSSTETPEEVQLSLQLGDAPAEPEVKAEAAPEPEPEPEPEEEDLGKYTAKQIHDNPKLRIQKATAEAAQAKREAEEARRIAADLEQKLARAQPKAPVGDKEPQEEDFETYKDYVKAQARWEARQEFEERSKAEEEKAIEVSRARAAANRAANYRKAIEAEGKGFLDTISEDVLNINSDTPLGHSIATSPLATKLMKHFTEHPDELRALSGMHPALVFREIGKIEGKLEGVAVTASAPRAVSKAKPPVRPVAGTPSVGDELPDDASFEDYVKHENAKERARLH